MVLRFKKIRRLAFQFLIFNFLIFSLPILAEGRGVGTSGNSFLKIGVGARSTSMGDASTAVVDDVTSIYWNPAGLVLIKDSQISAMHIEWFDDIRYEWIGFAQPITSRATIAADVSYMYMGSIARTIESPSEGYEEDGTFSPTDMAGRIAFATRASKNLLIGGSFQRIQSKVDFSDVIKERIGDKIAQSMAINIGCIYSTPVVSGLSVGFCLQNLGRQTQAFVTEKEPMPFTLNLGVAYKTLVVARRKAMSTEESEAGSQPDQDKKTSDKQSSSDLTMAMDLSIPADSSISARLGAEYRFGDSIVIRGGYRTGTGFDFPSGLCGGMGYNTADYQVDYAFVPYGNLGNTHRVSFTIRF